MATYTFDAICETCGFVTLSTEELPVVKLQANLHSLRKPGHVLLYRSTSRKEDQ